MSLTKEEMLKLAKKCGAKRYKSGTVEYNIVEPITVFIDANLDAYTSAIEAPLQAENEKLRVEVAMLVGAINAYEAAKAYARQYGHLTEASEQIASAFEDAEGKMQAAISATQATAEAFRAEIEAKALESSLLQKLIATHAELLEANPYCYFELAYTRRTEWMAWLCSKPQEDDPLRIVLAKGQGATPNEAAEDALNFMAAEKRKQAEQLTNKEKEA